MGQLLAHRGARCIGRCGSLILWGLAFGAELAVAALQPGQHLVVDGVPAAGTEVLNLAQGSHTLLIVNDSGSPLFRHLVLLGAQERVVIDPTQMVSPEASRGPIPDRTVPVVAEVDLPQTFVVGAVEREAVRVHVDGVIVPFDPETQTYRVELDAGPHVLDRYVAGGRRAPYPFEIKGKPWQCAVGRSGDVQCVEVPSLALDAPPIEVIPTRELLARTPPNKRLEVVRNLDGAMSSLDVATIMADFMGDDARVEVARILRPHVRDPWNADPILNAVSFPDAKRMVKALYAGAPRPSSLP